MMPKPNQAKHPEQSADLSTHRQPSTIPNPATNDAWVYPSEQMFYNALRRKGKADGVDETLMGTVVSIHNNMNEKAWRRVLEWEAMHCDECDAPKLLRFVGRPDELSPKARLKYMLGLAPRPFDRHDWTVDRCGKEVRYILDYYDVAAKRSADRFPGLHEEDAVPSIELDVRPALDTPSALVDRVRAQFSSVLAAWGTQGDATSATGAAADAAAAETPEVRRVFNECGEAMASVSKCEGERECAQAHMALTMCIAEQVCEAEAGAFRGLKGTTDDVAASARWDDVQSCVSRWGKRRA